MAKGFQCPECEESKGTYKSGAYHCGSSTCGAIWWHPFDKPVAGRQGKGYECSNCQNQTVHEVGKVAGVTIWRCTCCSSTIVSPT